jgi:hypothetical protein
MRANFVFSAAVPLALAVFAFASCSSPALPENPEPIQETPVVPAGAGTPVFAYLDAAGSPAGTDTGTAALAVTGNEFARGVAALSQIPHHADAVPGGYTAYDTETRVINANDKSVISLFFRENQRFPYRMAITAGGAEVTADFSLYNYLKQTFSVTFQGGENEYYTLSDITMNKDALTLWNDRPELDASQNARMRNMITALCVWDCIAAQLPGSVFYAQGKTAGQPLGGGLQGPLAAAFSSMAVAAFAASAVPFQPAALASASGRLRLRAVSYDLPGVTADSAWDIIHSDIPESVVFAEPSGGWPQKPHATVRRGGEDVPNNGRVYHLANLGDFITFDLQVFGTAFTQAPTISVFSPNFDANSKLIGYNVGTNPIAYFFTVVPSTSSTAETHYTITRAYTGGSSDGRVQYIIRFGQDVVINGSDAGIMFQEFADEGAASIKKNIFVINFNVNS